MSTGSIIFNKTPLNLNPAYNNSIIEYHCNTLTDVRYSEIIINSKIFKVYPINGVFTFNFKDIVKVLINQNNFNDTLIPDLTTSFIYDDTTLSYNLTALIKIYDASSMVQVTKNYSFIKSVEQLPNYIQKIESTNPVRVLLPTLNNIDYYAPYFEGYPFDIAIYGLNIGYNYQFKNTSTVNQSSMFTSTSTEVKRIYFSDGETNEFNTELINLSTTLNNLELWVNGSFSSNINIKRYESKSGVYLKWFNASGGWSYWLFDEIFENTLSTKTIDEINGFTDNLQNITSTSNITGKNGFETLKLNARFNEQEKEYVKSILLSPKVEMYVHTTPFNQFVKGKFIGVKISDGSIPFNNKYSNYKMNITITLPEIYTQTL
ncbi:hypothetical protein FNW52_12525 [Flavobacterium sp. ZT3R18]|uniref:hypothetical protein n=1 Tax=Flavobacterium sp. ZT3R18 TaxID=2594429 RepID=UPI00117ADB5C|nr:hypothetical protein [Flavobacterium sp. ZT3R18]TRX34960.1 hypothetical protein FNW52_12525 [Flavobacterium sp. ZT3R18]